ncbi:hypothetical protein SERLA73DRAFT_174053 [Serpula lacrymans var. lacrymans S7.3]|uniref:Tethering factor for nuclear proteasome STS1 n=2 Tax=Serpula lacrymans var. lacrymans TaxID=341189 RepID=F8PHL6_SERL3|nr:uncharacterized protein SERLADRAFT_455080 [Serpula lacrymans var. lacrymans S7.9]EGO05013.1 hypothetical protein SERLA73DRAFT_174053 [Serpula lacrymans var. lacrymans S7.3]EGO30793.1 hypothetical protein SERLADRAFT_455080 [Serpula lacrymans var. lacrymans S7.9]
MANVVCPEVDVYWSTIHSASSYGSNPAGDVGREFRLRPGYSQPVSFQQLAYNDTYTVPRLQKRRHETEDPFEPDSAPGERDDGMDQCPAPERSRYGVSKRVKTTMASEVLSTGKESTGIQDDIDVGVLLAGLPPHSLLTLLNSLIHAKPSLKSFMMPLIPRPTLDMAIQALALSAKKLRDAYPYSNAYICSPAASSTTSFGFAPGGSYNRFASSGNSEDDFARLVSPPINPSNMHGRSGIRESYIITRIQPHMQEFVSTSMSYLPYFSHTNASQKPTSGHSQSSPSSSILDPHIQYTFNVHPTETFGFLSALTNHCISQPPLTRSYLIPLLLPRLTHEWEAWVDVVDEIVNEKGGMFGRETVRGWERTLDELAEVRWPEECDGFGNVRDKWVSKVGWLLGKTAPSGKQVDCPIIL